MKKTIFYPKVKLFVSILILLSLFILISAVSYVDAVSKDLSDSVFRLHVIANSDEKQDQDLKYVVRDAVLNYVHEITKGVSKKEEIISIINSYQKEIQEIAQNIVIEQGYSYPVTIEIGNFAFPTKTYGDISFPSGYYDALRIKIGEANGHNWWCVMFPPLCFVDVSSGIVPTDSKEVLKDNLSEEEYALISDTTDTKINFKFKLIEFFQNFSTKTAQK